MSEPFIGEIRMFAGNFALRGWALFYGGDGRTTFSLPDLRGRLPMHAGTGPGLSNRRLGAKTGTENVTLTVNQLPSHSHGLGYSSARADATGPVGNNLAASASGDRQFAGSGATLTDMNVDVVANAGGSGQHPMVTAAVFLFARAPQPALLPLTWLTSMSGTTRPRPAAAASQSDRAATWNFGIYNQLGDMTINFPGTNPDLPGDAIILAGSVTFNISGVLTILGDLLIQPAGELIANGRIRLTKAMPWLPLLLLDD